MNEIWEFFLKIGAAILAGLIVGVERELKNKHAGLKTNALVSAGAAIFVIISLRFKDDFGVDITRVLSQVVVGIGFLGAGVIIKDRNNVKGLTTAATVWCSAGLGCLAAAAMYWELLFATLLIIIVNYLFGIVDKKIN